MLVLGRAIGEKIILTTRSGDTITVTVVDIHKAGGEDGKGYVRIGIEAPLDITIDREEVAQRKAAAPAK